MRPCLIIFIAVVLDDYTGLGEGPYPDGRRVEQLLSAAELATVRFEVGLDEPSLRAAIFASLAGTRRLLTELTGKAPTWPELK